MADDFLQAQPQYGDAVQQQALLKEAPISGAPTPTATPQMPAPAAAPAMRPPGVVPITTTQGPAPDKSAYYIGVAKTWAKLARSPHATPMVKEMALRARQYAANVQKGIV